MDFIIFISVFIVQRISELILARRNEKWLRANGAIEYGKVHYPYIVLLHFLFIISMIFEYLQTRHKADYVVLAFFILLLVLKFWTIASLGKFWNTKILRIPGMQPIKKGPYTFLKHPNYIIVIFEFMIVPLVFNLYYTAIIFSVLNAIILSVRIREENFVWLKVL